MRRKKLRQAGFTLIEIMVVVVILGILATIVVPKIMDRPDHARIVAAKQDIRSISSALDLYRLDHSSYPHTLDELVKGATKYLDRVPKDPWRNDYQYTKDGYRGNARFDLYSYGADGQEGGNDEDTDIGNWNLDQ